ncbi:MAG: serine/threonine-protein kinase, partial [Rubripirellula sp.]
MGPDDEPTLPPEALQSRVDSVCDAFEDAWKKSESEPDIGKFLADLAPEMRLSIATELFLLDRHYRERRGIPLAQEEYVKKYEAYRPAIDRVFSIEAKSEETIVTSDTGARPVIPGQRLRYFGDYELLGEIARGGMGVVYRAKQVSLNRIIALKMILSGQLAGEDQIRRFQIEAESAANLDHPGIVPIYDIGKHEDQHYFSMKLIEGCSLNEHAASMKEHHDIVRLVAKIADAVHHAHQRGILHRDLKPSNILIDTNEQPVVTDFGLARQTESTQDLTQTGAVVGTPGFMSPEQAAGDQVTTATDIYSLGAILYSLLCGQPPHAKGKVMDTLLAVINDPPTKPSQLAPEIPRDLELICLKCLAKKPNDRYASAAEFASELRAFADGRPLQVRAPSVIELTRMWLASNYGSIVWVPIIALICGVLFGVSLWAATTANRYVPTMDVYERIAPSERPWLVRDYMPVRKFSWLICFLSVTMIGWATASWVRTKNGTADVGAGLSVGLLAGLIALIVSFGPIVQIMQTQTASSDLGILSVMARGDAEQTREDLMESYPALADQSHENAASMLLTKHQAELEIGLMQGSWLAPFIIVLLMGT